jgi:hypothetical protein
MTSKIALVATFKMIADFRNKICQERTKPHAVRASLPKRRHVPVTDQIVSGRAKEASAAALLMTGTEKPMEILEPTHKEAVPVTGGEGQRRNERQPHGQGS